MTQEHELNIVLLEERTEWGWMGLAEITCPHCGLKHVLRVAADRSGRSVSFWRPGPGYTVNRETVKP